MKEYRNLIIGVIVLPVLQLLINLLYVYIYPTVNPLRALMIGATAFVVLLIAIAFHRREIHPVIGGLSIFLSAFFGALLVSGGALVSKSFFSGLVHLLILWIIFAALYFLHEYLKRY